MELRVCDCRNTKFQGQTIAKEPQGFGLALDDNYSLILSEWDKGSIGWPFLTIFGNSTKVYGDLINKSECLLVYSTREYKIFKNNNRIVVDFLLSQVMILVSGHSSKGSSIRNWAQDRKQKLIIIEEVKYTTANYLNKLEYLLEILVPSKYLSYQNFLKQTFRTTHRDLISFSESSKEVSFSFMNEGIFAKLDKASECLVSLGSTGPDRKIEICRRYSYCRDFSQITIEESITTTPSLLVEFSIKDTFFQTNSVLQQCGLIDSTSKYLNRESNQSSNQQEGRPIECIKSIREYYKRSLTFTNKYLNLSRAYEARDLFESIYHMVKSSGNRNYAQVQLDNSGVHIFHNGAEHKVSKHSEATIEDWKKEITRAMGNKEKNRGDTSIRTSPPQLESPKSPYSRIKHNTNNFSGSQKENIEEEFIKTPSRKVGIRRRQTAISFNPSSNQPFQQQAEPQPLMQPESKLKSKPHSESNQKSRILWQSEIQIETKFESKSEHNFEAHEKEKSLPKFESDLKSLSQSQLKSKVESERKCSSKLKKQPEKRKQNGERTKSKTKIIYTEYESLESITKCLNGMNGEIHKSPNFVKFKYVDD